MHTLAGDDHNFHYAVYLLVMSIMALIILFACTFKFEKHCRCAPPLLPVMTQPHLAGCLPATSSGPVLSCADPWSSRVQRGS